MLFLLAGVVFHATGHPPVPRVEKDWLWWKPPTANSTRKERFGLSRHQVLELGYSEWRGRVSRQHELFRASLRPSLKDWTVEDAGSIIYSLCMRERNDEIFARNSKREQNRIGRLRAGLFRFGMTCIAMEVALKGGGMTQLHAPSLCFMGVEATLDPRPRIRWQISNYLPIDLPALKERIDHRVSITRMASRTQEEEVKRWKKRAFSVFSSLDRDLGHRNSSDRGKFEDFLRRWMDHIGQ